MVEVFLPEVCDEVGRVICPEGHLVNFEEFDKETLTVTYCGDKAYCSKCNRVLQNYVEF